MTILVYLIQQVYPKLYNIGKRFEIEKTKSTFHIFLFFEQGSPIGLL